MMESVELLLNVALMIVATFFVATWVRPTKSNNSKKTWAIRLWISTALTIIEVLLLTVNCLMGEDWGLNLALVFIWLSEVVISAFALSD